MSNGNSNNSSGGGGGSGRKNARNANHLLNFQPYAPQTSQRTPPMRAKAPHGHNHHHHAHSGPPPDAQTVKRAVFLQNFQFVLGENCEQQLEKHCGNRSPAVLNDFDTLVPWDAVKYAVVRAPFESFTCPICLEPPVAPRITTCSHVYCYSCILRFLMRQKALGQSRTCPMCSAFVSPSGLRPAIYVPVEPPAVAMPFPFTLLLRDKNSSCVGVPDVEANLQRANESRGAYIPNWDEPSSQFSRYSIETRRLRQQQQDQDVHDLQAKLRLIDTTCCPLGEDDAAEVEAITAAIAFTSADTPATYHGVGGDGSSGGGTSSSTTAAAAAARTASGSGSRGSRTYTPGASAVAATSASSATTAPATAKVATIKQTMADDGVGVLVNCEPPTAAVGVATEPFTRMEFYRASDGQQVYLHHINVRMLRDDAASSAASDGGTSPSLIREFTAPILDVENVTQSKHLRTISAMRPLSHIPEYASFTVAFVDLSNVVSAKTMAAYQKVIDERARRLQALRAAEDAYLAEAGSLDDKWAQYKSETLSDFGFQRTSPGVSPELMPNVADLPELPPLMSLPGTASVSLSSNNQHHADPTSAADAPLATPAASGKWGSANSAKVVSGRGHAVPPPKPSWGATEWKGGSINARPVPGPPTANTGGGGSVVVAAAASSATATVSPLSPAPKRASPQTHRHHHHNHHRQDDDDGGDDSKYFYDSDEEAVAGRMVGVKGGGRLPGHQLLDFVAAAAASGSGGGGGGGGRGKGGAGKKGNNRQ